MTLITQLGIVMTITMLTSVFLGLVLDNLFKTGTILTIIFSVIGGGAMLRNMYVFTMKKISK